MPELSISNTSTAAPERVWQLLLSEDTYPEFIDDVLRVEVVPQGDGERVASWAVSLDGAELEWRQHEHIDDAARELRFTQLDGDLSELSGRWSVRPLDDGGTLIALDLAFEIGIPLLADVLNPIAVRELGEGFQEILDALGSQSSKQEA
jgi:ribosome-associated toxin RatA of RatAB toxin-antitoxin module